MVPQAGGKSKGENTRISLGDYHVITRFSRAEERCSLTKELDDPPMNMGTPAPTNTNYDYLRTWKKVSVSFNGAHSHMRICSELRREQGGTASISGELAAVDLTNEL